MFHRTPRASWRSAMLAATLAAAAPALLAQTLPPGADPARDDPRWTWDLTRLFPHDAAWDAERQALAAEVPALAALKGSLGRDAATLRDTFDRISAAGRRIQRLWVYASTQLSTDTRVPRNQERTRLMTSLWGQLSAATAWVDPEVQALGAEKVEAFLRAEPGLARHAVRLRTALRMARHTLTPEAEAALAAVGPVIGAPSGARTLLVTADARWPTLQVDGKAVKVDDNGYQQLREHTDRAVRKQAFDAFYGAYRQYENTLGALLAARVEAGTVNARLRSHPSAVAASLAPAEIPEEVVRTLVAEANRALPTLHRYFRLRQRLLGLADLHYYDVYPDLVPSPRRWPLADAAAITLEAMRPLGEEYGALLRQALAMRTMHVLPAEGKQSGAYQTGVYGVGPFVFLNHQDTYDSLTTFAHEWGHGIHTMLAHKHQPFETAGYSLFTAETASITNEVLLAEHQMRQARSRDERLFLLDRSLERLRGSYFRQAMFAEFELQAHDAHQRGEALSGKRFTQIYCDLLKKYHGADAGVMRIDPLYCQEWAYIPHFFRPFYVYVYATSTAAAYQFGQDIAAGRTEARDRFLDVLRAGGSKPPYRLLKDAGVDLATPTPYRTLERRMNEVMDELEKLLGEAPRAAALR